MSKKTSKVEKEPEVVAVADNGILKMTEVLPGEPDLNMLEKIEAEAKEAAAKAREFFRNRSAEANLKEAHKRAAELARLEAEQNAKAAAMDTAPYRQILENAYGDEIPEAVRDVLAAIMASIPEDNPAWVYNPVNHRVSRWVRGLADFRRMNGA